MNRLLFSSAAIVIAAVWLFASTFAPAANPVADSGSTATVSANKATSDKPPAKPPDPKLDPANIPSAHFDPTDAYEIQHVDGWELLVNKRFKPSEPELYEQTMAEVRHQLYNITRKVQPEAVNKLRKIRMWVDYDEPHTKCMCYHPRDSSPAWLKQRNMNPEMAGCVELANAHTFVKWTLEQPWMVLHEFSHGYHDQFLAVGYDNPDVLAAYKAAMEQKLYDAVLCRGSKTEKAYATTNQMEYFAELSEAYFGTNDFYPFVNAELRQHDPHGYETLKKVWGPNL